MTNMLALAAFIPVLLIVIAVLLSARENRLRTGKGKMFIYLSLCAFGWILSDILTFVVRNETVNIFIWNFGLVFTAFCSYFVFIVIWQYFLPDKKLPKFIMILFAIIPVANILLALSSGFHSLMRDVESITVWPREITYEPGSWFTIHTISAYVLTVLRCLR